MDQNDRLYYCKQCENRAFNPQVGLICSLTDEKPAFENECSNFEGDPAIVRENQVNDAFVKAEYTKTGINYLPTKAKDTLYNEQNYKVALLAGFGAAILGACVWTFIGVTTGYSLSIVAIGIGLLIGFTVRLTGKGIEEKFGITGALLTLLSIILGDFMTIVYVIADEFQVNPIDVFLNAENGILFDIFLENIGFFTIFFWIVGIAEGYKFAFRVVRHDEVEKLLNKNTTGGNDLLDT